MGLGFRAWALGVLPRPLDSRIVAKIVVLDSFI